MAAMSCMPALGLVLAVALVGRPAGASLTPALLILAAPVVFSWGLMVYPSSLGPVLDLALCCAGSLLGAVAAGGMAPRAMFTILVAVVILAAVAAAVASPLALASAWRLVARAAPVSS